MAGQPQPAGQPAIKYVDQYGNPVAPPTQQSPQQPAIKYVDQYGNPYDKNKIISALYFV